MRKLYLPALLALLYTGVALAVVPVPAPDQAQPIALTNATIHVGNGEVISDGVITFDEGVITAVGTSSDNINLSGHLVVDVEGQHIYPGLVLPNTYLGLREVGNVRSTQDVVEEGDINASVRSAIAYNTDSEYIPTHRFNGILTAQITPEGGLVSGSSSIMKLDGWNWEDTMLRADDGMHLHWPSYTRRRRNQETNEFETVENEDYAPQTQLLHELFQNAVAYTGPRLNQNATSRNRQSNSTAAPLNLNLAALQPALDGAATLFIHANEARQIISAVRFARTYGIANIVLVGGRDALLVKDFLLDENIPVIYEAIHALPSQVWRDVDESFRMPFLLHEAGLTVGIGGGAVSLDSQRNLPFFAGTAAAYGLDRETALSMITRNNAEILGVSDRVGTLETGKDATLFISIGDVLDMRTSQVEGAFIQGRNIDLYGTQQELYERFRDKYNSQIE
ncbi:MAG: amidohydrolase family protein [Pseudohongiellaceae bacterium]